MAKSFWKSQWKSFCSSTGIKAFGFLNTSSSTFEAILWLLTIVVGFAATIYEVCMTVSLFNSGLTATKVIVKNNETLNLDNFVVCAFHQDKLLNFNTEINVETAEDVSQLLHYFDKFDNLSEYFQQQLDNLHDDLIQFVTNEAAPNRTGNKFLTLMQLTAVVLSSQMRIEMDEKRSFSDLPNGADRLAYMDTSHFSTQIKKFYSERNFTPSYIGKLSGITIWCSMGLYVVKGDVSDGELIQIAQSNDGGSYMQNLWNHCKPERNIWFGQLPLKLHPWEFTCVQLNPTIMSFKTSADYISLAFDPKIAYGPAIVDAFVIVSVNPDPVKAGKSANFMVLQSGYGYSLLIHSGGIHRRISTGKSPCGDKTYLNCLLACRASYMTSVYGCAPYFSGFLHGNLYKQTKSECGFDASVYANENLAEVNQNRHSCAQVCLPPCETQLFQITTKEYHRADPNATYTEFQVYVDSFVFPEFDETPLMQPKQFLAQLGGNLSFWIGASFIALLHLVLFFIKLPYCWLRERTKEKRHMQVQKEIELSDLAALEKYINSETIEGHLKPIFHLLVKELKQRKGEKEANLKNSESI